MVRGALERPPELGAEIDEDGQDPLVTRPGFVGEQLQHAARRGADHDLHRARIQPIPSGVHGADAAAHAARRELDQVLDHGGIGACTESGVEIDHSDLAD